MKPKFYIFLDIDGVMYDWDSIKKENIKFNGIIDKFSTHSVEALNYLMEKLRTEFTPVLVISSTWRKDMFFTIRKLKENGVKLDLRNTTSTPITSTPEKRGQEILSVLKISPKKENYVIIDDEMFDYREHFSETKIIKTNIFNDSLRKDKIDNYFKNNNLSHLIEENQHTL